MKKLIALCVTAVLLLAPNPAALKAENQSSPSPEASYQLKEKVRAMALLTRLDEINRMDKSDLNEMERIALREEVISIKKDVQHISGGIYLSGGAIILILILILLLG